MKWSKQVIVAIWMSCLLGVLLPLSGAVFAAVPTLAITESNILNGTVTVSGTLSEAGSGQLLIAVYTTDGKMTDVKDVTSDAADGNWSITLEFPGASLRCVKAFLLANSQEGYHPLLTAEEMITSGMLLTIDTADSYSGSFANVTILESALTAPVTLLDMDISGNLTIGGGIAPQSLGLLTAASQTVSLTGSTSVAGKVVLNRQGASAQPLQLILEEQAHIQSAEVLGSAGAVIASLTETENTINSITAGQNLQLINTKVGQLTALAGNLQALQVGLYQSEVQNLTVAQAAGATPVSATLGKQVSTFAAAEALFDDLRTARIDAEETLYLNAENKVSVIEGSQALQLQQISEVGSVTMTAALQTDAETSVTALTTNADAVIAGRLQRAQMNAASLDSAPNLTLLGSGVTTLSGKIKKLTLGGEATAILTASTNGENEIGSVEMQTSEPAMQSLSLNLLALSASSGPSFTVMSGSGVGGILTSGSGNLGGISILNGTGSFVPIHLGPGVFAQFVQFGNNSGGQLTLGGTDNQNGQLGALINNSPMPSQLFLPAGSSQSNLISNVFDSNISSGLQMRIGETAPVVPASNNDLAFVGMNIVEPPRKTTYKVNETMDYSGMMVELIYLPGASSVIRTPIVRYEEVKGNQNFLTDLPLLNSAGSYTLQVTHRESQQSVDFLINVVNAYEVEKIRIVQYPAKLTYQIGEPLNLGGGVLAVTYQGITGEQIVPMMTDNQLTDGLVVIGFNSTNPSPQRVQLIFGRRAIVDLDVVVGGKSTLENYRTAALAFITVSEANAGLYSNPELTTYNNVLSLMKGLITQAETTDSISYAWEMIEKVIRPLKTNEEKLQLQLSAAREAGYIEIEEYWPINPATQLPYSSADYSSAMLYKIRNIRLIGSRSVSDALTLAEINGELGLIRQTKAKIDAIPRISSSLDIVLAAVSDFSLTIKTGLSFDEKIQLVKENVSRQMISAGGNPLWSVLVTDLGSGSNTVQIADGSGHLSSVKTITVSLTEIETRGSLVITLANHLQGKFSFLPLNADAVIAETENFVETINMTAEQKTAFAFLSYYHLLNGRGQIGNQQIMDPNATINRADFIFLLTALEEAMGVRLPETVTIAAISDLSAENPLYQKALHLARAGVITLGTGETLHPNDSLVSAASDECLSAVDNLIAALSSVISSAETSEQFQTALTDTLIQKIVTAGNFVIDTNDPLNKQLFVTAGTTLTVAADSVFTIDTAQCTVMGTMINEGAIHVTVNGSLSFMAGSVLTNNNSVDVYGRADFQSGSTINGSNTRITYHHNANLLDAAQQIYQQLKDGYRLDLLVQTDINDYAGFYADWSSIPADQAENIMAMAFLLKNQLIVGVPGLGDDVQKIFIKPYASLSRAETAMLLIRLETVLIEKATITGLDQTVVLNPVFNDLNGEEAYYDAVLRLAKAGVVQGDTQGNFNPNAAMDATWYTWGSPLSDLVRRFVTALGQIASEQQSFTVLRSETQVIENRRFTNKVSIVCGTPVSTDDYGGSIRFSNCTFAAGLTAEVGLIRYDIDLGKAAVVGGIQVNRSPDNKKFQQNVSVNLNNVAVGTEISSDAVAAVNCGIAAGSFVINGVTVSGAADLGEQGSFGAHLKWECYAPHAESYQGDHSECSGNQFTALAFYDAVEKVEVSAGAAFQNYEMWNNRDDISLNFPAEGVTVSMDRLRINNRNQEFNKTLILSGQVLGDVEISGKVDLSALLNPSHQIYLAAWNNGNQIAIGSQTVTVSGQSDYKTSVQAENGATVIVEQSRQDVVVNDAADNAFSLGGPHIFGDVGNYGIYLMGAPLPAGSYLLEQRTMNAEQEPTWTTINYRMDSMLEDNKTHLIPDPATPITDPFAVRLTVRWQPDANTEITIVWPALYYKQAASNRIDLAKRLYAALGEGYGLAAITGGTAEVETLLSGFEEWPQLANEGEGAEALAFLVKNGILNPTAGTNLLPYNDLTRSETAVILYQAIIAMNRLIGLDQSVNISFHDVIAEQTPNFMAIMTLAKAGIVSGDNQGNFYPNERMLSNQIGELITRFVNALGEVARTDSAITSFTVSAAASQPIRNKNFLQTVTIDCVSIAAQVENGWGGRLAFENCNFSQGLILILSEASYGVELGGAAVAEGIQIVPQSNTVPNRFNNQLRLNLSGLADAAVVTSTVGASVNSQVMGGQFTLNHVLVRSTADLGEANYFGAYLRWECYDQHIEQYQGDHSECDPSYQFTTLGTDRSVASLTVDKTAEFQRYEFSNSLNDVQLLFDPDGVPVTMDHMRIIGCNTNGELNTVLVSGLLQGSVEAEGRVDLTNLAVASGAALTAATWSENTQINLNSHAITLVGNGGKTVGIAAVNGATVCFEQAGQKANITNSEAALFEINYAEVLESETGYWLTLNTGNGSDYSYRLEQGSYDQQTQTESWSPLTFTTEVYSGSIHTDLMPSAETPITNPNQVRLIVTWTQGSDTITVVWQRVFYQMPKAKISDAAKQIYQLFQTDYKLLTVNDDDLARYAADYSDWTMMNEDGETRAAVAFLLKNGILSGTAAEDNLTYLNPYQEITRAEFAKQLFALVNALSGNGTLPGGLAVLHPNLTFSDVVNEAPYYEAVMSMAKAGILSGDNGKFCPDELVLRDDLNGILKGLQTAVGPVVSTQNLFTVNRNQEQTVENKIFSPNTPVVITSAAREGSDAWGGQITFVNCQFNGGLQAMLGNVHYNVNFTGTTTVKDNRIDVSASVLNANYKFDGSVSVQFSGLPESIGVVSSVAASVASNLGGGSVTLNGIKTTGADQIGTTEWFTANLYWECNGYHTADYAGNHAECIKNPRDVIPVPADHYLTYAINGKVKSVTVLPSGTTPLQTEICSFRVAEVLDDVSLALGSLQPSLGFFNLNGNTSGLLTVSGNVIGETVVCGKVDITALTHPGYAILIGAWQDNTAVVIGSQTVTVAGYNSKPVIIAALSGAVVKLELASQAVKINAADPDGGFQPGIPQVFDIDTDFGINLGKLYTLPEYSFELWQNYYDNDSMQEIRAQVSFTSETSPDQLSTYLLSNEIRNPYQLELTVRRTAPSGTISVIWQQLEYKQAAATLSQAAKLLCQAFRQDYRLAEPTVDELTAYAAYADWSLMAADADAQAAMAFLLCNHVITATAGSGEDANKFFVDPNRSLTRSDVAVLVYNLSEQLKAVGILPNGLPQDVAPNSSFSDVTAADAFYTAVMTLAKAGLLSGDNGQFYSTGEVSADDVGRLINALQSIIGPISSGQTNFIVSKNQTQTVQSKTFSEAVTVTCEPGQSGDWGGEIRFTDCSFNGGLTLKLGDISYAVNLDGVTLLNQTIYAVLDGRIQPAPVQLNSQLQIRINGVATGTIINSTVNVNVSAAADCTGFQLNGVEMTKAAAAQASDPFGAQIMWECNGDHADGYNGNHADCIKDRNNPGSGLAEHYLSLLLWGKTGSATVINPENGQYAIYRYEMTQDCTCASLSLGNITPAIGYLFLTSSTTANCAVSGTVTGDLVVIGSYDISAVIVTRYVLLSASWARDSLVSIGAKEVTITNNGNTTIGINASDGARINVEQPDQYFVINQAEPGSGFAIGIPHVFGDAGNYGVYVGTANATEYTYTLEQILYDENHPDGYGQPLTVTPEYFVDKTHLNPSVSTPITDPNNVRLTVTWTKNNQVITVVYAWLNYLPPTIGRVDAAMKIYAAFQDGYDLAAPTSGEISNYSLSYSVDWAAMSANEQAAMAFLLKHGLISGAANEIKPYNMLTRAEIAVILDQLDAKLAHHLTGSFTVPNFSDLVGTEAYYAAVIKMVEKGVIADYEGTVFAPNNGVPDQLMREYLMNFISALAIYEQIESTTGSFVVSLGFDQVINNKNFITPVTITCNTPYNPAEDYNQGGNIVFNNCSFSEGLTLILDTISFDVDLRGANVPGGINLVAGSSLDPLDGDKSITLYSLANGTTVTSAVNCMIENYCVGDSYTLNLVKVQSIPPTGNEMNYHFGSNIYWNCGADHPKDYVGDHSECATADRFMAFAIFGNVQTLTVPATAAFQRYEMWNSPANVNLVFETPGIAVPYLVIIGGDNENCLSSFVPSGIVDSDVIIINNVNAANLTVTEGHIIYYPDLGGAADKTALISALETAGTNFSLAMVSETGADILTTFSWVTPSAFAAYQIAVQQAQSVAENGSAT